MVLYVKGSAFNGAAFIGLRSLRNFSRQQPDSCHSENMKPWAKMLLKLPRMWQRLTKLISFKLFFSITNYNPFQRFYRGLTRVLIKKLLYLCSLHVQGQNRLYHILAPFDLPLVESISAPNCGASGATRSIYQITCVVSGRASFWKLSMIVLACGVVVWTVL